MRKQATALAMLLCALTPRLAVSGVLEDLFYPDVSPPTGRFMFLGVRSTPVAPLALTYLSLPTNSRTSDQVPTLIVYVYRPPLAFPNGRAVVYSTSRQVWDCKRRLAFGGYGADYDARDTVVQRFSYLVPGASTPSWPLPVDDVGRQEFGVICEGKARDAVVVGDLSAVLADAPGRVATGVQGAAPRH